MNWPFKREVARHAWVYLEADGFPEPVPGCVYDGPRLDGGIPLGGIGTGYFTLEGCGKVGHCSIFNDIVPPRRDSAEWLTVRVGRTHLPLSAAQIAYWGHYPVADLVARFDEQPLSLGIRAFSPFIVGDAADSNIPAVLFEIEVENRGREAMEVELVITPPLPSAGQAAQVELLGAALRVASDAAALRGRAGLALRAGEAKRVRFVFGWYAPNWRDSSHEPHVHRYGLRYESVHAVAQDAMARFDSLLARVLAWQGEVYRCAELPEWLRDGLVQSFYSLAKNAVWIGRTRKDEWWGEEGWYTHNESHTGCPLVETMVCRMHGHFPALLFFPELEASTLEAFGHFQISDGEVPFCFGSGTAMRDPRYHCQHPLNSGQFAQMVYRLYLRTGNRDQLACLYERARRAIRYQFGLDDDGDGLVNDQAHVQPGEFWPANQFYDIWPWWGTSAYVAGTWLATLSCGRAMAEELGDAEFAAECAAWLDRGKPAFEEKLWTGEYYRVWNDLENHRLSEVSLGNQLMAQWCVKVAGLPDLLPAEKVQRALASVERLNMRATAYGLVNGVTAEGERYDAGRPGSNDHGKQVFIGENLCAAMTFIYHNRRETGVEVAKRLYEAVALKSRSPWKQRCLIDAETGQPVWGEDYYSNMVIWALPMAMEGEGIRDFCEEGKLVDRMIMASRRP